MKSTEENKNHDGELALKWWRSLNIMQKIAIKDECKNIVGLPWADFNIVFTPKERLQIIQTKLLMEGIILEKNLKKHLNI